jgi:hypothetical protein
MMDVVMQGMGGKIAGTGMSKNVDVIEPLA